MMVDILGSALRPLLPVLIIAIIAFVGLAILKARLGDDDSRPVTYPYERRSGLFTAAEAHFLLALRQASPGMDVFGKVRLEDVIAVERGLSQSERQAARNRISQRHLDFVLTDPRSTRVLLAVELDDASHASPRARKADAFKDGALRAAGVPLLRVRASGSYDVEELAQRVRTAITPEAAPSTASKQVEPFAPS